MKYLNEYEHLLIELVHYLSYGNDLEHGLTPQEIKEWLIHPIPHRGGKTALECLKTEGEKFLEDLRLFISSRQTF